jgi:hypothetical protein
MKECAVMKNFVTSGAHSKGKKPEGDPSGKGSTPLPGEDMVMSIYGRPVPQESRRNLKLMSSEVNGVSLTTSVYL